MWPRNRHRNCCHRPCSSILNTDKKYIPPNNAFAPHLIPKATDHFPRKLEVIHGERMASEGRYWLPVGGVKFGKGAIVQEVFPFHLWPELIYFIFSLPEPNQAENTCDTKTRQLSSLQQPNGTSQCIVFRQMFFACVYYPEADWTESTKDFNITLGSSDASTSINPPAYRRSSWHPQLVKQHKHPFVPSTSPNDLPASFRLRLVIPFVTNWLSSLDVCKFAFFASVSELGR